MELPWLGFIHSPLSPNFIFPCLDSAMMANSNQPKVSKSQIVNDVDFIPLYSLHIGAIWPLLHNHRAEILGRERGLASLNVLLSDGDLCGGQCLALRGPGVGLVGGRESPLQCRNCSSIVLHIEPIFQLWSVVQSQRRRHCWIDSLPRPFPSCQLLLGGHQ